MLIDYITEHSDRGECTCCTEAKQPSGHTADVIFFKVKAHPEADAETLKKLILEHSGDFNEVDLFDGKEHGFQEIGGWIGDQGLALLLMGLGSLLGLWELLTPRTVLGEAMEESHAIGMARAGLVIIKS